MKFISFEQFYENIGLIDYPFRDKTAEKENVTELFIDPIDFSYLKSDYDHKKSIIICGNRGTGKTMTLLSLQENPTDNRICCSIDCFEKVELSENRIDFYNLLLENLTRELLIFLSKNKRKLKKAIHDDKILISFLIKRFGDNITDNQLYSRLEEIQLSWWQSKLNRFSTPITSILNYGGTAATNFGNELLNKHFSAYLPNINEGEIKRIFPDINFRVEHEFKSVETSYSLLNRVLEMIVRLTGYAPVVFFDRLDEDIRLENDAELTAKFFKDIVCDSALLLNKNIQLIISVWKIPFDMLGSIFRASKNTVFYIKWNRYQLEKVLNQRLSTFSNGKITNYRDLFDESVTEDILDTIYNLSNSNPRDLWSIYDAIFRQQYSSDSSCNKLTKAAVVEGLHNFVENFQFYEYYPRPKTARKNTNDIYSYIRHLLKLNGTDQFTSEELRNVASTGGSTQNYITSMMNIGLVNKTGEKRPGGAVIYEISDPKVTYAIHEKVGIRKI